MPSLEYSPEALNVLHQFHEKKFIFFVEGIDDIPFWNNIFIFLNMQSYKIKTAGGIETIINYSKMIIENDVNIYIARDSHYSNILNSIIKHPRIIYTYGHSFENSICCNRNILSAVKTIGRLDEFNIGEFQEWLDKFLEEIKILIIFDIANIYYTKGINVLGRNCSRVLLGQNSCFLSKEKINECIKLVNNNISDDEYSNCEKLANDSNIELRFIINGHILFQVIINFISHAVKRSVSYEALYSALYTGFMQNCSKNRDIKYIIDQLSSILEL